MTLAKLFLGVLIAAALLLTVLLGGNIQIYFERPTPTNAQALVMNVAIIALVVLVIGLVGNLAWGWL